MLRSNCDFCDGWPKEVRTLLICVNKIILTQF